MSECTCDNTCSSQCGNNCSGQASNKYIYRKNRIGVISTSTKLIGGSSVVNINSITNSLIKGGKG